MIIEIREATDFIPAELRDLYHARWRVDDDNSFYYGEWIRDEGEVFHPFYEILRRSMATSAMRFAWHESSVLPMSLSRPI